MSINLLSKLEKLECVTTDVLSSLSRIEAKIDMLATKADLHEMSSNMIKWMVGTAVALGAAAITVMTFVLNNATPQKQSVQTQPPPIIINVPAAPPAAPAK